MFFDTLASTMMYQPSDKYLGQITDWTYMCLDDGLLLYMR